MGLVQLLQERPPIGQPGQRIGQSHGLELLLVLQAFGDVPHEHVEPPPVLPMAARHRRLHREPVALTVHGRGQDRLRHGVNPGLQESLQLLREELLVLRRKHQRHRRLPDGLLRGPAQEPDRSQVPVRHPAGVVRPDERVAGGVQDRLLPGMVVDRLSSSGQRPDEQGDHSEAEQHEAAQGDPRCVNFPLSEGFVEFLAAQAENELPVGAVDRSADVVLMQLRQEAVRQAGDPGQAGGHLFQLPPAAVSPVGHDNRLGEVHQVHVGGPVGRQGIGHERLQQGVAHRVPTGENPWSE